MSFIKKEVHELRNKHAERDLKRFLKLCNPYKIEFSKFRLTYLDAEINHGEVVLKYKLDKK